MSFSLLHMWASMGLPSRVIAIFLVLMATMSLAVVVERHVALIRARTETRRFLAGVGPLLGQSRWSDARKLAATFRASPFARLVGPVLGKLGERDTGKLPLTELAHREAERQKEVASGELRRGMGVLASVGSVAPFVGLLGTVVGIISAFQGIASTGSGGLGAVSAGISEALVETALGLCVAIPAVLFFNQLTTSISTVEAELSRRTGELLDELENSHHAEGASSDTRELAA